MTLMCSVMAFAEVETLTTAEELRTFLTKAGTAEGVLTASVDITDAAIVTQGDKTLTLNDDVVVTYKRFSGTYVDNINIPSGATLTLLGNGTFSGNNRAIATLGGELVIGPADKSSQPHFTSTRTDAGCIIQANSGTVTIHNADVRAAAISLWTKNGGNLIVNNGIFESDCAQTVNVAANSYYEQNGGTFINNTSTKHGTYSYTIMVQGHAVFNDGLVSGVHGGVDVSYWQATAEINGGTYETRPCIYGGASHYALYASTYGVATVRGGKFKSADKKAVFCGNNDVYSEIGVVNIYGGEFATKAYVQYAPTNTFPASVPTTSQWYSSFGTDAPLPAGYEYYETGDATYPYGVRAVEGKEADAIDPAQQAAQEADPTYTIPWQQATTWAADEVPVENTIVTIPVDATVTVSKDEAVKDAVADQVYVSQGATLKVEEGTTLTVGDGGMNIGNGGQIVVEAGATVKIGSAGVITTEEEALVIESNDDVQGVLLYEPSVDENTQPKATVKLTTKAKQIGANSYVFERFAIPTVNGAVTNYSIEGGIPTSGLYNDAPSFLQAVWEWNNTTDEWEQLSQFKDMQPFHGYQLTNNSAAGGLVYVFEGNLVGNQNKSYEFVENGFHFFGNSYSADINIKSFLDELGANVEKTVWVYDPYDKTFKTITRLTANGRVKYGNGEAIKDVRSMQAFLMYLSDGTSGTAGVNYSSAIWGNPKYNGGSSAPARQTEVAEDWVTIRVSAANGLKDEVILNQSEDFTAAFENGADANKFMNNENINLYAATNAGNLAVVATNDLNNTVLTFAAGNAAEYTLQFADIEGYEFTLRDNVTGARVLMTEGATYTFSQDANTTVPARFEVIGAPQVTTAIGNVEATAKEMGIYTITGQFLGHDFTSLPAGVYVVNGVKIVK